MNKYIIAGLGNPGSKYNFTKHNVGFDILDLVVKKRSETWKDFKKAGKVVTIKEGNDVFFLYKPQEFMNLSGKSILEFMNYFAIETENLMIVHDEIALQPGIVKYSLGGDHNSHNGVGNVIQMMQSKDFVRVKFGIGYPFEASKKESYVLSPFPKQLKGKVKTSMRNASNNIDKFIKGESFTSLQNDNNSIKEIINNF